MQFAQPEVTEFVMNGVAIALISLTPLWFLYLASPSRQSLRAVAYLAVVSLIWIGGAAFVAAPLNVVVAVAAGVLGLAGLFGLHRFLGSLPHDEFQADQRLWSVEQKTLSERRRLRPGEHWGRDLAAHIREVKASLSSLDQMRCPNPDWDGLRRQIMHALEKDLIALEGGPLDEHSAMDSIARWKDVDARREEVRRRRANFWR